MKKAVVTFLLCLAASLTLAAAVPDASWSIVISGEGPDAERHFDRLAAELLQEGLKHLTGAELKIVTGEKPSGKAVFVGRHADPKEFENSHWHGRFRTDSDGNWYFAGSYRPSFSWQHHLHHSVHEAGVIRCAALFLREYAGLRVPLPGTRYHVFTERKNIDFPAGHTIEYDTPDISYCNGRHTNDPIYDLINGYLPGVWYFTYGGHSHPVAVPLSVYDEHPEYFILTDRNERWRGRQYCISNPEFQELVYQEMCRKVDEGYEWVQLAQTDGFGLCRCKNCQEYGGTGDAGEKLWILHRALAERFHRERPGRKVVILCYHPNLDPPVTFDDFPPNVVIEMCRYSEEAFRKWQGIRVPCGFVAYIYNWGDYQPEGFSPKMTPEQALEQLRLFRRNHVRGIYRCGFGNLFGLEGPTYYAYGQGLVDPEATAEQALDEFCRLVFPQAPDDLKNFYRKLYGIMKVDPLPPDTEFPWHRIFSKRMPSGYRNHLLYAGRYDEKSLSELDLLLKKCEEAAPENSFSLLIRRELELIRYTARMSRAFLQYLKEPSEAALDNVEKAVAARKACLDTFPLTRDKKCFAYIAGLPLFGRRSYEEVLAGGSGHARFVYPAVWPFGKLREYGIVPGARIVHADGREHALLPAFMDNWDLNAGFRIEKNEEGLLFTLNAPAAQEDCGDVFFLHIADLRILFRCGGEAGASHKVWLARQVPVDDPANGDKFAPEEPDGSVSVKRLEDDTYSLFLPWKYLPGQTAPATGETVPLNILFQRKEKDGPRMLVFEPDLKYLNERSTWASGRGRLSF